MERELQQWLYEQQQHQQQQLCSLGHEFHYNQQIDLRIIIKKILKSIFWKGKVLIKELYYEKKQNVIEKIVFSKVIFYIL